MIFRKKHRILFWGILFLVLLRGAPHINTVLAGRQADELIVSEFVALNTAGLLDEDGDYSDWIEVYNRSAWPVNLSNWYLSDNPKNLKKWQFPAGILNSGDYLLVYASGKDRSLDTPGAKLHTNFKLKQQGGFLALSSNVNAEIGGKTGFLYPQQHSNISYGYVGQANSLSYFTAPSPGHANSHATAVNAVFENVQFSVTRGFYNAPFMLALQSKSTDAVIIYTTDSNEPSRRYGAVYTQPIAINASTIVRAIAIESSTLPSNINTHTYLFVDDVVQQSNDQIGFSPGVYATNDEAAKFGDAYVTGKAIFADIEMDSEIVNNPRYHDLLTAGLSDIPSLSLVMDSANADIFLHPAERGREWERPVAVELIQPDGKKEGFGVNAGIRIQGGKAREEAIPKNSFRLTFRNEYGPDKLKYALFPDSLAGSFNTLVLRGGVDETFIGGNSQNVAYTKDQWLRASQIEMSGNGSHGIFVHLYLNGLYWGLYNVVERPDASFADTYFGGGKNNWYARSHRGPISGAGTWIDATKERFITAETTEEKYAALEPAIDFAQFSDYVILNWYAGNTDWGGNNWYSVVQNPMGHAKYFVWDGEQTWTHNPAIYFTSPDKTDDFSAETIFYSLIAHPDFKRVFADRIYANLFNDGPLTDANVIARWEDINRIIDRAIVAESARWGDVASKTPLTRDDWLKTTDAIATRMEGNRDRFIEMVQMMGFYPLIDPPAFNLRDSVVEDGFRLILDAPSGEIYYTLDGSNPGEAEANTRLYQAPVVLTQTTRVRARVFNGGEWSALNEVTLNPIRHLRQDKVNQLPPAAGIAITEIMYNPLGGDKYEFIELQNISLREVDLSNMKFRGIKYIFPQNSLFPPGARIVLVGNPQAFAQRYPDAVIGGVYKKKLSNKGESIALEDPTGQAIIEISYDDEGGWPLSPDGRGDSLVIINPTSDPNNPRNWQASDLIYGSPGEG